MEALENSNCQSLSDSFSLYERYLRTFNVVNNFIEESNHPENKEFVSSSSDVCKVSVVPDLHSSRNILIHSSDERAPIPRSPQSLPHKTGYTYNNLIDSHSASLLENLSATEDSNLTERSNPTDVPLLSSEDSKSDCSKHPKPVIITSLNTMENSNNAVDSVPLFQDVRQSETVFKLPLCELSFNGTLKHVQNLKPIVDPLSALTSASEFETCGEPAISDFSDNSLLSGHKSESTQKSDNYNDKSVNGLNRIVDESTGDSQYEEHNPCQETLTARNVDDNCSKWSVDQSFSSLEGSFDSGVRSPDMFSDDEEDEKAKHDNFWDFIKDFEVYDKIKIRKMEETIQGVLPPPSVTILKTDVTEMLKRYYCFLPAFNGETNKNKSDVNPTTPIKLTSLVQIPIKSELSVDPTDNLLDSNSEMISQNLEKPTTSRNSISKDDLKHDSELGTSNLDKSIIFNTCTEVEAKETAWHDVLKCRYFDVHYNVTKFSERIELLALKCGERYVGAETDSSLTVYSGALQSPSSASKRKALRLKIAQAKSPGRRLSHLARRRQAFCSAATISEKAHGSNPKMVLIDKNFFPHRKLINSSERKSPRLRRTPGKRTPGRKTPGKKTPAKTPKTRSGGSSRKKAMRRLLMDPDNITRSQPTRESSKRALFISPENRKSVPQSSTASVPVQAMKSKRALFGSPVRAETKSLDGSQSDLFLKRKRDELDESLNGRRSKIAKSLSFGGDSIGSLKADVPMSRRASEMFTTRSNMAELDEHHRKKLLWAVSEALRVHGWRMQSPGFREKASLLARLTRRLLTLPPHAKRLATPNLSTSETMLKIARQYVFAIIQGRSVDDCFQDEQNRLANEGTQKVTGYISASAYQQIKVKPSTSTFNFSQIKENTCDGVKLVHPRSNSKNILQDKLLNVDSTSNSSSGLSMLDKTGLYKSNSMPSFEEAAKMRARRQISFDNVDFPKR